MSATMKRVVATPIVDALHADPEIGPGRALFIVKANGGATSTSLGEALAGRRPGLVVTTSHGKTGSDGGVAATTSNLGLPVGDDYQVVAPTALLAEWDPYGAIWYSHACCSAGSSSQTVFEGLFEATSDVGKILTSVAGLGDAVAPLPTALLGNPRPIRSFIGHVEPTFDWTISQPDTGQPLANGVKTALYNGLYRAEGSLPIGFAFKDYFDPIGTLAAQHVAIRRDYDLGADVEDQALATQLSARDRMSTVILGDPTVALPIGPR
jgi:hypothetical protein